MRVTSGMLTMGFTQRLHERGKVLWDAYDEVSSGRKVNRPSDDPASTVRILQLQRLLSEREQFERNIAESRLWLELTDSALERLGDAVIRGRELAVAGASSTLPLESRLALAAEVDQLFEHVIQVGNSNLAERYLFAGHNTLARPYVITGLNEYDFSGDGGEVVRQISRDTTLAVGIDGARVVSPVLDALADLAAAVRAGDSAGINATLLPQVEQALDELLAARAEVGARGNRLERSQESLLSSKLSLTSQLSDRQDADFAESIMRLRLAEAGYQGALTATSRVLQQTLLDYLR